MRVSLVKTSGISVAARSSRPKARRAAPRQVAGPLQRQPGTAPATGRRAPR